MTDRATIADKTAHAMAPASHVAAPTLSERLQAGLIFLVLLSLGAAFWAAVIHYVAAA